MVKIKIGWKLSEYDYIYLDGIVEVFDLELLADEAEVKMDFLVKYLRLRRYYNIEGHYRIFSIKVSYDTFEKAKEELRRKVYEYVNFVKGVIEELCESAKARKETREWMEANLPLPETFDFDCC